MIERDKEYYNQKISDLYAVIENQEKIIRNLQEKNKQSKDNWNNLKQWLEYNWKQSQDIWFVKIINKMKEILKGDNND